MPRRPTNRFEAHPRSTMLFLVVAAVLVLDALAGLLFIPTDHNAFRQPHHYYHHDLIPNTEATSSWIPGEEFELFTNSLGFKDRKIRNVPLHSDKRRIVFIGDSFTEGVGIPYESTFVGLLEDALEEEGAEVLNAGVIGYSPKIYYLKIKYLLEQVGLRFDELYVLVDFSDVPNEIIYERFVPEELSRFKEEVFAANKWLMGISYIWYTLETHLANDSKMASLNVQGIPFTTDVENAPLADPAIHNDGYWDENYKYAEAGFRLARENLQMLVELCSRFGIRVTIVVYPWPSNIARRETDHVNRRFWQDFSRDNGLAFVDLFPRFADGSDPLDVYQRYFIPGDVHWNAAGHKAIAEELLEVAAPGRRSSTAFSRRTSSDSSRD